MGEVLREVEASSLFREFLERKAPSCFLCLWTLNDIRREGRLTGWPFDSFGKSDFPVSAKLSHAILELGDPPPFDYDTEDDLACVLLHLLETSN